MKIKKVELLISNFEQTVQFYEQALQFKILSSDEHRASLQIGESILELIKDNEGNHHYYHFAFNIHVNMFNKAKEWLSKRVELLKEDGSFILLGPLGRRWLFSTKEAVASPVTIHSDKGIVSNI